MSEENKESSEQNKKLTPMEMVTEYEVECAVVTQQLNDLIDSASEAHDLFQLSVNRADKSEATKKQLQAAYDLSRRVFDEGKRLEQSFISTTSEYALAFGEMYITELTHAGAYGDLFKHIKFQDWRDLPEMAMREWLDMLPPPECYPKIPPCFGPLDKKWDYFHSLEAELSKVAVYLRTGKLPETEEPALNPQVKKGAEQPDTGSEKLSKEQVLTTLWANADWSESAKGRISSITIENFKGIGEKVTIPLKPITLLFGANSAGKSTVLQALLYAHEVMNNRNPDADVTEFGGEKINLGGFRNLVHGHDLSREIKIGFEYILSDDGLLDYGLARDYEGKLPEGYVREIPGYEKLGIAYVEFVVSGRHGSPQVSQYSVDINGQSVAEIRSSSGTAPRLTWLDAEVLVEDGVQLLRDDPEWEEILAFLYISDDSNQEKMRKETRVKFPDDGWDASPFFESKAKDALPLWADVISFASVSEIFEQGDYKVDPHCVDALLSALIASPGELIANELKQMRYIGPIREIPPRNYTPQKTVVASRWADGMAGWDLLLNDMIAGKKWFAQSAYDKLDLGYEFLNCWEMTIPSSDIEKYNDVTLREMILKTSGKNTVRMRDVESQTSVEPCDVGTGVSQVIPVVAGAMSPGCRYLSVEQPELHLHPAIQCNLGDLFISQSKRYPERTFLLETHSEHLILRLLRRIRETSDKSLPDPSLALTPEQVGVLYVSEAENGVSIKELPITSDGDFSEKWPQGFFDERAEELF